MLLLQINAIKFCMDNNKKEQKKRIFIDTLKLYASHFVLYHIQYLYTKLLYVYFIDTHLYIYNITGINKKL